MLAQMSDIKAFVLSFFCNFARAPISAPKFAQHFNLSPLEKYEKHKPFKPAYLYDAGGDLSKRWYINFYVWDELKNKLVRKRDYTVNDYDTVIERKAYAKKRIAEINEVLAAGFYIKAPSRPDLAQDKESKTNKLKELPLMKIGEAFDYVLELKKQEVAKGSYKKIRQVRDSFLKFFNTKEKPYPFNYEKQDLIAYSDFLITVDKKSTKTRNDNITWLRHIFELFKERGWITENPAIGIKKLKVTVSKKNKAFSPKQVNKIKALADPQLLLSIQFLYYCFMRRNETRLIQLKHINLKEQQLFIPAAVTKNRKDAYLVLPPPLIKQLEALNLNQYPDDYYLIGNQDSNESVVPAPKPFSENVMYNRHTAILKELDLYGKDYTFYSWKHTGVVTAYKAGIDIKNIQMQCRHHSLNVTDIYLKSLGLGRNLEVFSKMPEL